jgi:pimeloyl-ACP methyl ester carboxylesterase
MWGSMNANKGIEERRLVLERPEGPLVLEYLEAGKGDPVLLLHGVADSAHTWERIMPRLAPGYRLYAPSLPGFGRSDKPGGDYSPAFFTDCAVAFLDALGLERVRLVGHSLGGLVALRLALAQPGRVASLTLIGSAGLGREVNPAVRSLVLPGARESLILWGRTWPGAWQWSASLSQLLFARPWLIDRAWYQRLYRMALLPGYLEAVAGTLRAITSSFGQSEILLDQLHRVIPPTRVFWGERDWIFPVRQGRAAVERLPRGRLVTFSRCGHTAHFERPEPVAAALAEFWAMAEPIRSLRLVENPRAPLSSPGTAKT